MGDLGSIPRLGRSLGEGKSYPPNILAWRNPWTEEPGRLWSMGLQRVEHGRTTFTSLSVAIYKQKLKHDLIGASPLKSMKDSDTLHHVRIQLILGTQSLRY